MPEAPRTEGLHAAIEKTKQIITLSTGVIAITVTFFDTFGSGPNKPREVPTTLLVAWGFYGLSILAAILTIGAITGTLDCLDRRANGQPLDERQNRIADALSQGTNIRVPAVIMDFTFIVALILTIVSGFSL